MASPAKHTDVEPNNGAGRAAAAPVGDDGVNTETLAELRAALGSLTKEVSTIVEHRSRAAAAAVRPHVENVQQTIRRQPAISMAVAAGVGALLALALVPRLHRPRTGIMSARERWMPNVTRADLNNLADQLSSAVSRLHVPSMPAMPDTSSFERMLAKFAHADPSGPVSSAIDKLAEWAFAARKKVNGNGHK